MLTVDLAVAQIMVGQIMAAAAAGVQVVASAANGATDGIRVRERRESP